MEHCDGPSWGLIKKGQWGIFLRGVLLHIPPEKNQPQEGDTFMVATSSGIYKWWLRRANKAKYKLIYSYDEEEPFK